MNSHYPISFKEIAAWAATNHVPATEARQRYAQYGILQSIAGSKALSDALVFKGGNALDFVWQPNRSTLDLDFSSRDPDLTVEKLREFFEPSLQRVSSASGTLYRVQKVGKQPPGEDRSFVTFTVSIGYALADDARNQQRIRHGEFSKARIPVEISMNEPICATQNIEMESSNALQVSTEEDIFAEKLRALLQQIPRNRTRPQDVLDIAVNLSTGNKLRPEVVADYLHRKAGARNVEVSLERFHDAELWSRAEQDYGALESTTRTVFIPFLPAKKAILAFVETLNLRTSALKLGGGLD